MSNKVLNDPCNTILSRLGRTRFLVDMALLTVGLLDITSWDKHAQVDFSKLSDLVHIRSDRLLRRYKTMFFVFINLSRNTVRTGKGQHIKNTAILHVK